MYAVVGVRFKLGLLANPREGKDTEYGRKALRKAGGGYHPGYRLNPPIVFVLSAAALRRDYAVVGESAERTELETQFEAQQSQRTESAPAHKGPARTGVMRA